MGDISRRSANAACEMPSLRFSQARTCHWARERPTCWARRSKFRRMSRATSARRNPMLGSGWRSDMAGLYLITSHTITFVTISLLQSRHKACGGTSQGAFGHRFRHRVFWLYLDIHGIPVLARRIRWLSHNRFNLVGLHDCDHGPVTPARFVPGPLGSALPRPTKAAPSDSSFRLSFPPRHAIVSP